MSSAVWPMIQERGYFLAEGIPDRDLPKILAQFGSLRADPRAPELIREIRPQKFGYATPNTLSSRHGLDVFPFHTDTAHWREPAKFLALYCICPGDGERPTLIQDSWNWQLKADEEIAATREVWKTGHIRPALCTLGVLSGNRLMVRYDEACMTPMTSSAKCFRELILEKIKTTPFEELRWQPGMLLVLDNRRMLHARGKSTQPDLNRVIKRALIGE